MKETLDITNSKYVELCLDPFVLDKDNFKKIFRELYFFTDLNLK